MILLIIDIEISQLKRKYISRKVNFESRTL